MARVLMFFSHVCPDYEQSNLGQFCSDIVVIPAFFGRVLDAR